MNTKPIIEVREPRLLTDDELAIVASGHCPVCRSRGFVIGPIGGAGIMIECATGCRARMVVAFFSGDAVLGHYVEREAEGGMRWPSSPGQRGTA